MPQWMQDLMEGWPMIRANLPTFAVIVVLLTVVLWWFLNQVHNGIVANRDSVISNKDSEIALLRSQRDEYKNKLSGATPDEAKAKIVALEGRIARLEPRRLSDEQRQQLADRARIPRSSYLIAIVRDVACHDGGQLATDIASVFVGAGWVVATPTVMGLGNPPPRGIAVRCANPTDPSQEAKVVIDAMRGAQIKFDLQVSEFPIVPGVRTPSVEIIVSTPAGL